jgi:hypothetical protein
LWKQRNRRRFNLRFWLRRTLPAVALLKTATAEASVDAAADAAGVAMDVATDASGERSRALRGL